MVDPSDHRGVHVNLLIQPLGKLSLRYAQLPVVVCGFVSSWFLKKEQRIENPWQFNTISGSAAFVQFLDFPPNHVQQFNIHLWLICSPFVLAHPRLVQADLLVAGAHDASFTDCAISFLILGPSLCASKASWNLTRHGELARKWFKKHAVWKDSHHFWPVKVAILRHPPLLNNIEHTYSFMALQRITRGEQKPWFRPMWEHLKIWLQDNGPWQVL